MFDFFSLEIRLLRSIIDLKQIYDKKMTIRELKKEISKYADNDKVVVYWTDGYDCYHVEIEYVTTAEDGVPLIFTEY